MGFDYHVSQCAKIVAASCHAATIAVLESKCNRLLFFINASLGHYRPAGLVTAGKKRMAINRTCRSRSTAS